MLGCLAKQSDVTTRVPIGNAAHIAANTDSFLAYSNKYIDFSASFKGLDSSGKAVGRGPFLQLLVSGKYLPLRHTSSDTPVYQLHILPANAGPMVADVIKNAAALEYFHHQLEGKPLKDFDFTDLSGRRYTAENTAGKIVVLKCWFIRCHQCVEEMPSLNKLVEANTNNPNIVFVSLALDPAEKLRQFLLTTSFKYAVVPDQQQYLTDTLGIEHYPTHIIIGSDGKIVKIVNKASQLLQLVEKLLKKQAADT